MPKFMFFSPALFDFFESNGLVYGTAIAGKFLPPARLVFEKCLFRILTGTLGSFSEIYYEHFAEVNLN